MRLSFRTRAVGNINIGMAMKRTEKVLFKENRRKMDILKYFLAVQSSSGALLCALK